MPEARVDQTRLFNGQRRSTAGVVLADQAVNSISNVVLTVWVANATTPREFGIFATVQVIVNSIEVIFLGGIGDLWLRGHVDSRRRRTHGLVVMFMQIAAVGAIVSMVATFLGAPAIICVVFIVVPGVAALDHVRIVLVASGHAVQALVTDLVFAALQVAAISMWLDVASTPTAAGAWLAWAGAAYVTWVVIGVTSRKQRLLTRCGSRSRFSEVVNVRFAGDMLVSCAAPWVAQLVFSVQLGVTFNGVVRAAQIPFGPMSVLLQAARPVLIPRFSRGTTSGEARRALALSCAAVLLVAALCTGVGLVIAKSGRLKPLLGGVDIDSGFILLTGLGFAVVGVQTIVLYFVRARGYDRAVSVSRGVLVLGFLAVAGLSFISASSTVFLAGSSAVWVAVVFSMLVLIGATRPSIPNERDLPKA